MVMSPGVVSVSKSKSDINIRCARPGYQDAIGVIPSNFQGWTVGNILLGGIVGFGVDAATGAMNDYPNSFQVPMFPEQQAAAPPVVQAAPVAVAPVAAPAATLSAKR